MKSAVLRPFNGIYAKWKAACPLCGHYNYYHSTFNAEQASCFSCGYTFLIERMKKRDFSALFQAARERQRRRCLR